jgi:hypothetical protein
VGTRTAVNGLAALALTAAVGIAADAAAGDGLPTLPAVTVPAPAVPTVAAPAVTAPAVTVPQIHATTPPAPVPEPTAPATPSLPSASLPVRASSSSPGSRVLSTQTSGTQRSPAAATPERAAKHSSPRVTRLRTSRAYLSLAGSRTTRITFRLASAGTVVFLVQQIAPVCRLAARVRVKAHAGLNAIRIDTRIGRRELGTGTYRFVPRGASGRRAHGLTLVVVEAASPTRADIASARARNACATAANGAAAFSSVPPLARSTPGPAAAPGSTKGGGAFQPPSQPPVNGSGGAARASGFVPTTGADNSGWMRPLLLAGVGFAALLLALAAMPEAVVRTSRFGELVANRRLSLAIAGGAILVAFVLAYVVSGNGA